MGNKHSTRWPRGYKKKTCINECRRLSPREARHTGIATVTTPMPRGGLRYWCLCPVCNGRRGDLFQRPGCEVWACRECHGLTYSERQRRRARVMSPKDWPTFLQWLQQHQFVKAWLKYHSKTAIHKNDAEQFENALCELLCDEYNAEYARLKEAGRIR